MYTRQIVKTFSVGILVVGVAVLFAMNVYAHQQGGIHSLFGASAEDVKEAALKYTQARFQVLSDNVTIPLVRPVTKKELPLIGLPEIDFGGEDPPLMLVVLKGEFDVQGLRHTLASGMPWHVMYIVYIFDLKAGSPTLIYVSPDGAGLGDLLNDPSLPEKGGAGANQTDKPEEGVASPISPAPAQKLPYGAMEPAVPTPSSVPPTEP